MNNRSLFLLYGLYVCSSASGVNLDVCLMVNGQQEIKTQLIIDEVTRSAKCDSERILVEATVEKIDTETSVNFKILKKLSSGELEILAEPVLVALWDQEVNLVIKDENQSERLSLTLVATK